MEHRRTLTASLLSLALVAVSLPVGAEIWTIATRANNIHCEVGDGTDEAALMCVLFRRSGPPAQPKPADCAATWGHAFFIPERGPVRMQCLEKRSANWPGNGKFAPNEASDFGGITCKATRNTLECSNLDGHGFRLSRRAQTVF